MNRPLKMEANRIIGLDLSKKTFVGCQLSKEDDFIKPKIFDGKMDEGGRQKLIQRLQPGDYVVLEGGSSSAYLARYILKNSKADVFMLNPCKLHIIFETAVKTDKQDAVKLAKYIRDFNPENWCLIPIPTEEESSERSVINSYIFQKEERTKCINKLHAVFNLNGVSYLKKSDLTDGCKRRDLINNLLPTSISKSEANMICDAIDIIELTIDGYEDLIRQVLLNHPKETLAWLSIPGIGLLTAMALIAYVNDGKRFSTAAQLRNYVGLLPRIDQSGMREAIYGVNHYGCKPIRRNIVQAAWSVNTLKFENGLTEVWKNYSANGKRGQKTAIAVANKMLTIGWTLLKKGELYNGCPDYKYLERKLKLYKLTAINKSKYQELL